ncbi:MAG: hypothetical protein IIX21_01735 [Clostridia bacterium]|nr:hypothetical protein [Clostridia bacterium]MEE0409962.1 MazG-like family protein [Clostridia bacterium]
MNIANNLVAIEEIKSDILGEVADLYKKLADYDELSDYGSVESSVATIIAMDYILARHLGIAYSSVDSRICDLLEMAEENSHPLETGFSDMSELSKYIKKR